MEVAKIEIFSFDQPLPLEVERTFGVQRAQSWLPLKQKIEEENPLILIINKNFLYSQYINDWLQLDKSSKELIFFIFYGDEIVPSLLQDHRFNIQKLFHPSMTMKVLSQELQKVLTGIKKTKESTTLTSQVRAQNRTLNELHDNLESLVTQRTQYLEVSNKEIEEKNKEAKELVKFIKSISSINDLEDLLLILKYEFTRYHKLNPPLLIYSLHKGSYRLLYFQGPQIIDRPIDLMEKSILDKDIHELRKILATTLSRPMGSLLTTFLSSSTSTGILLFEHSMDLLEQKLFTEILDLRKDSLRVALDRILLKMKSHEISKQWSTTFDYLQDPIVILDKNYQILRANKLFLNKNESTCYKAFAGKETPCFGCPLFSGGAQQDIQMGKIASHGRLYQVNAYPIHLESRQSKNYIVHYTDITHATDLQSQLVQSEKMSAIGMLAGNIAHELNNPLTGIQSLAQLLIPESTKQVQEDLSEVANAADRCQTIIKNLLEFSSMASSGHLQKVSAKDLILKTLPLLKAAMRSHNCQIDLVDQQDTILVEPHLLQQVIFNLVNNACQAMGETGDLILTTRRNGSYIEIVVRDSGPGVPAELKEVIFTPFFTTKKEGQGTGLGLSLGKTIVQKFGGDLLLSESTSKGSEFIIRMPTIEGDR